MASELLQQLRRLATEAQTIIETLTRPPGWIEASALLHEQHREVARRLGAVAGGPEPALDRRLEALRRALHLHARAEEVMFRALDGRGRVAFLVAQSRDEHRALAAMIDELHRTRPPCWREHAAQMRLLLEDHMKREEKELFPRAVRLLGPGETLRVLEAVRHAQL